MKKLFCGLLLLAGMAFGSTCSGFMYTVGGPSPTACTVDGGAVAFTGFSTVGFASGDQIQVTFLDPGSLGALSGVTFAFNPAVSGHSYALGYSASVTGGVFTGINDSATPGGVSQYDYVGSGFGCVSVATCVKPVMLTNLVNTGAFVSSSNMPSQSMTLDFNTRAAATPEPGTLGMLGIGSIALGLIRKFKKV